MKYLLLLLLTTISTESIIAQNAFKKSLNEVSLDIAQKLVIKNKKKIAVLYITDANKAPTTIGKYMADVISNDIVNHSDNFQVFDRDNLTSIIEAKKLMAEGYIDAAKAKEIGRILEVDAILVGNYVVLNTTLEINLKALDVSNGLMIASSNKELPINSESASLLGINFDSSVNTASKGFNNRPLNSNEAYNNPETVNKECEVKNTGDYCFCNGSNEILYVVIGRTNWGGLTLNPKETKCFYNKIAESIRYKVCRPGQFGDCQYTKIYAEGDILIEKCKSKTFVIK
jgi:TolB-like protein